METSSNTTSVSEYSCKDGKWDKLEPIYGIIVQPTDEDYYFD